MQGTLSTRGTRASKFQVLCTYLLRKLCRLSSHMTFLHCGALMASLRADFMMRFPNTVVTYGGEIAFFIFGNGVVLRRLRLCSRRTSIAYVDVHRSTNYDALLIDQYIFIIIASSQ